MSAISINKDQKPKKTLRKLTLGDFIKQKEDDTGKYVKVGEDGKFILDDPVLKWTEFNEDNK